MAEAILACYCAVWPDGRAVGNHALPLPSEPSAASINVLDAQANSCGDGRSRKLHPDCAGSFHNRLLCWGQALKLLLNHVLEGFWHAL